MSALGATGPAVAGLEFGESLSAVGPPSPGAASWGGRTGRWILQPALTQVDEGELKFLLFILDEVLRRLGHEHLATAGGGTDPGRAMDRHARVVPFVRDRLAGMNAHPHPHDRHPATVGRQSLLHLQRAHDARLALANATKNASPSVPTS